jgi:hypothetical protein
MTGPVTANSTASFVQQFMRFPRQSIPRTLLYSVVANVAFYQLASRLARIAENKYPSTDGNKKAACGVVVFGGLTALFNMAQFKLFNFQLSRVVSLAIGIVITTSMIFVYSVRYGILSLFITQWKLHQMQQKRFANPVSNLILSDLSKAKNFRLMDFDEFLERADRNHGSNPELKIDTPKERDSFTWYKILIFGTADFRHPLIDRGFTQAALALLLRTLGVSPGSTIRPGPGELDDLQPQVKTILNSFTLFIDNLERLYGSDPELSIDTPEKRENLIHYIINDIEKTSYPYESYHLIMTMFYASGNFLRVALQGQKNVDNDGIGTQQSPVAKLTE